MNGISAIPASHNESFYCDNNGDQAKRSEPLAFRQLHRRIEIPCTIVLTRPDYIAFIMILYEANLSHYIIRKVIEMTSLLIIYCCLDALHTGVTSQGILCSTKMRFQLSNLSAELGPIFSARVEVQNVFRYSYYYSTIQLELVLIVPKFAKRIT